MVEYFPKELWTQDEANIILHDDPINRLSTVLLNYQGEVPAMVFSTICTYNALQLTDQVGNMKLALASYEAAYNKILS